jgi:hypothetical protein
MDAARSHWDETLSTIPRAFVVERFIDGGQHEHAPEGQLFSLPKAINETAEIARSCRGKTLI